jgi:hypothetical protein
MSIAVDCVCGRRLLAPDHYAGTRARCPTCGRTLNVPLLASVGSTPSEATAEGHNAPQPAAASPAGESLRVEESVSVNFKQFLDPPKARPPQPTKISLSRMAQALLDPRSIHLMLILGGGLCVLGLVVWLTSLGIFENKIILAAALGAGTVATLGAGWFVTLKTRFHLAGQALTFLACVVAPLNLWFYHAQGLITLDNGLWVGGVVCCLLYAATLYVLRDPLFMYAIEAGVTLTVVLFLGQLNLMANTSYLCLALMGLAFISIHADRAFPPEEGEFTRRRFGMPLFWSGHAQLGAAIVILLATQLSAWLIGPINSLGAAPWVETSLERVAGWGHGLLPQSYLLATGLWLAGTYLYLYSDLVVRRLGVLAYLAAGCLLMAEVTLVGHNLESTALIALLAVTALAINLSAKLLGSAGEKLERTVPRLGLALSTLPVLMGIVLHLRATSELAARWNWHYAATWYFAAAMIVVAVANRLSAYLCRRADPKSSAAYFFFSAAALLVAAAAGLRLFGWTQWTEQAPALMLIPIAYLIAARMWRGHSPERPLGWIAHAATAVILVHVVGAGINIVESVVHPVQQQTTNLLLGLVFAEAALFYLLAAMFHRGSVHVYLATAAACGALWQLLGYEGVPGAYHTLLYAALGTALLATSRILGLVQTDVYTAQGVKQRETAGRGRAAFQSANAILLIALLAAIMQGWMRLPTLQRGNADWLHVWSLLLTTGAGAIGFVLAPQGSWRRAYAAMTIVLGGVAFLTLNLLSLLTAWQKLEIFATGVGVVLVTVSYIGRFRESSTKQDEQVTFGLWLGSVLATAPLLIAVIYHRAVGGGIALIDELALLTIAVLLLLTGFIWQVKATTLHGGSALVAYLLLVLVSLGWQQQWAIGVYLAIGGGLVFAFGLALSIYRDKLLEIPERLAQREGVFQIMNWR